MRVQDKELVVEPSGKTGIRFVALDNPPPTVERTIINRSEAVMMLQGHDINLRIDPELEKRIQPNPRKARALFDDPYLELEPKLTFQFMTESDMDPKTGMPRVLKRKGGTKILAAKMATFALQSVSFYSETSKMSAPSWSIPAGPPAVDGTCAAAELYRNPSQYQVALRQGEVAQRPADKKAWICAYCYAGKSNYMHRTSQYSQTTRMIWLRGMISLHGIDLTADVMSRALAAHMANAQKREQVGESTKFFRIHDSGDLTLSPNTYFLWCEIARQHAGISFWMPTRQWVFPKFVEMVRKNPPPANLTLRPSALHFNDQAPVIDGFHAGSTAHLDVAKAQSDPVKLGIASWSCPAYQHDGHSCAGAGGPKGEKDCRFCWTYKEDSVSYRAH